MKFVQKIPICFLFLFSLVVQVHATKWRINNTPGIDAHFSTLNEAIQSVSAGDTLYIEGSSMIYGTNDTINKPLTIIGPGYFLGQNIKTLANILPARIGSVCFMPGSEGTTLTGVSVLGSVYINENNIVISRSYVNGMLYLARDRSIANCIIRQSYIINGIENSGANAAANINIKNNVVKYVQLNNTSSAIIHNNVLQHKVIDGNFHSIDVYYSDIRNNIIYTTGRILMRNENITTNNLHARSGNDDQYGNKYSIDMNMVFVGSEENSMDGQWQLKPTSPARNIGYNGTDCGIFGGSQPYILSGLPPIPHIYELDVSSSGSDKYGLPVTIKVKSKN